MTNTIFFFLNCRPTDFPTPSVPRPNLEDRYRHLDSFKIDYTRTSFVIFDGHRWRAQTTRISRYDRIRF